MMGRWSSRGALAAALVVVVASALLAPQLGHAAGPWKLVGTTDGVTVHLRSLPNYHLPQMRGRVIIPASVAEVFAVLEDTARHPEWMAKTSGARLVKPLSGWDRIVWTRKKTPWPAQDRDAVLRVTVREEPAKRRLRSTFRVIQTPLAPKLKGVTRMPALDGYFELQALGQKETRVTYVLKADMGGWLPDWLVRLISKKLPLRDLQGLRRQTLKMRGRYVGFLQRMAPEFGGTRRPPAD